MNPPVILHSVNQTNEIPKKETFSKARVNFATRRTQRTYS